MENAPPLRLNVLEPPPPVTGPMLIPPLLKPHVAFVGVRTTAVGPGLLPTDTTPVAVLLSLTSVTVNV
jgi:hypothetical protein